MTTSTRTLNLTVNGRSEQVEIQPQRTLLQLLRQGLRLLGTEEGCGEGACGSCTVLVDGRLTRSCLSLAVRAEGRSVETIDGVAADGELDPVQQAFVEWGAIQCGFCTPGFVMVTRRLLEENPDPTDAQIRDHLSGNLCRCGSYMMIFEAVRDAAARKRESPAP